MYMYIARVLGPCAQLFSPTLLQGRPIACVRKNFLNCSRAFNWAGRICLGEFHLVLYRKTLRLVSRRLFPALAALKRARNSDDRDTGDT